MIVDLANHTKQTIHSWQDFNKIVADQSDIRDTLLVLSSFNDHLTHFLKNFERLSSRFSKDQNSEIQSNCHELKISLVESQEDLRIQRRQVSKIKRLDNKLTVAETKLNTYWSTYANEIIKPYHDLLILVFHLPEVKRQLSSIQSNKEKVESYVQSPPNTDEKLSEFDQLLLELDKSLSNLQGLSPVISDFLERVIKGSFSLAEINEEILEWCEIDDRGQSFKISFIEDNPLR